ncbi:MAG: hypothetical protein V4733_08100 [Verrucomicrobiota bacterium]
MRFNQHLFACAVAAGFLTLSAILPARETADPSEEAPTLTLAMVIKHLEDKAGQLAAERSSERAKATETGKNVAAFNQEKTVSASEIAQCFVRRTHLTRNKAVPSDPYYQAIRQLQLADAEIETLKTWWKHCRKGTAFESLAGFEQLALTTELVAAKNNAEKSVEAARPALDSAKPETSGNMSLNSTLTTRIQNGKGILDQIDGWRNLPEESKSKIIAR